MLLILIVAGFLVWVSSDDGRSDQADGARIQAALRLHNASFSPARETLRAWALFDDVRCRVHVTRESPSRVALGANLEAGDWLLIYIDEDEVDYDSYRQGPSLDGMAAVTDADDPERFFSSGEPGSVRSEGTVSSP